MTIDMLCYDHEDDTRAVPEVPELVRYICEHDYDDGTSFWTADGNHKAPEGEYVLYSQAAAIIAAEWQKTKDAEELAFRMDRFAQKYLSHMRNAEQRAEAAEAELIAERDDKDAITRHAMKLEAKLAQYEYVDEDGDVCIIMQQSEIDLANENLSLHEEVETLKNLLSQYEAQETSHDKG